MLTVDQLDKLDKAFYECMDKLEIAVSLKLREKIMNDFDEIYFTLLNYVKE